MDLQAWSLLCTGGEQWDASSRVQLSAWERAQHMAVTKRVRTLLAATIVEVARIQCHQVSEHVISYLTGDGREHYRLLARSGFAAITGSPCFICRT